MQSKVEDITIGHENLLLNRKRIAGFDMQSKVEDITIGHENLLLNRKRIAGFILRNSLSSMRYVPHTEYLVIILV